VFLVPFCGYSFFNCVPLPQVNAFRIYFFPEQAHFIGRGKRRCGNLRGDEQRESGLFQNLFQPNHWMQGEQRGRMSIGFEPDHGMVRDETVRATSAEAQFLAASPTDKAGTREVSDCLPQLTFIVPHDHDDALGK
jgi:hypothetical protein